MVHVCDTPVSTVPSDADHVCVHLSPLQKWSKGKVRDKLNNLVLFDKGTYEKLYKDVPNYKLITPSVVSERLKVRASLARAALIELTNKGTQASSRRSQSHCFSHAYFCTAVCASTSVTHQLFPACSRGAVLAIISSFVEADYEVVGMFQ